MFENPRFLKEQLITYIGNKRKLLHTIGGYVNSVHKKLNKSKLNILDAFSGSGVVSRYFKQHADLLISNDLEPYAQVINQCYLANRSDIDNNSLFHHHKYVAERPFNIFAGGLIRNNYAPKDDKNIEPGERVFFTVENAIRIDTMRIACNGCPKDIRPFVLAPLLSEASIHNNTSGVFKGFYKNRDGVGQYGGTNKDALQRITGRIELPMPVFSNYECDVQIHKQDANDLVKTLPELDLAYFDPPYNQHPYGSNYFMLNLITEYKQPNEVSTVSGIPTDWHRSAYNKKAEAFLALCNLVENTPAKFILISYNNEGFISKPEFEYLLARYGKLEVTETKYNAFRGSRNLRKRSSHVSEQLYLLERH